MSGFTRRTGLGGLEETCRATGVPECLLRIGDEEAKRRASVAHSLSRASAKSHA